MDRKKLPKLFAMRDFVNLLRSEGLRVNDFGDLPQAAFRPDPANPKCQDIDVVRKVLLQVSSKVEEAVQKWERPIVLGGDCTITPGVIAGMINGYHDPGLIYFDGDVDLMNPSNTHSGKLDGMADFLSTMV